MPVDVLSKYLHSGPDQTAQGHRVLGIRVSLLRRVNDALKGAVPVVRARATIKYVGRSVLFDLRACAQLPWLASRSPCDYVRAVPVGAPRSRRLRGLAREQAATPEAVDRRAGQPCKSHNLGEANPLSMRLALGMGWTS